MTHTDIHRPSVINPEDYDFIGFQYLGPDFPADRALIQAHMERTGGTTSDHYHGGSCHICGAHAIYTAVFHHMPSNSYIRTGLDCADKLGNFDTEGFRKKVKTVLEQKAGKRKAEAYLTQHGLDKAWEIYMANDRKVYGHHPRQVSMVETICDLVFRLVQNGNMTEKQERFLRSLLTQLSDFERKERERLARYDQASPLPKFNARTEIVGKVASVKFEDYGMIPAWKVLVEHKDGWKVWGTLPSVLVGKVGRGDTIRFLATIKPSERDPKFGFFSRPSKAEKVLV